MLKPQLLSIAICSLAPTSMYASEPERMDVEPDQYHNREYHRMDERPDRPPSAHPQPNERPHLLIQPHGQEPHPYLHNQPVAPTRPGTPRPGIPRTARPDIPPRPITPTIAILVPMQLSQSNER